MLRWWDAWGWSPVLSLNPRLTLQPSVCAFTGVTTVPPLKGVGWGEAQVSMEGGHHWRPGQWWRFITAVTGEQMTWTWCEHVVQVVHHLSAATCWQRLAGASRKWDHLLLNTLPGAFVLLLLIPVAVATTVLWTVTAWQWAVRGHVGRTHCNVCMRTLLQVHTVVAYKLNQGQKDQIWINLQWMKTLK